ncbi:MAG: hypothetical protein JWQ03_3228, partial [Variovorax sp.]|nr:hypothetical protein [Variovorax sp.]
MTREQLQQISALMGKPYVLGASGPDAYDCYGLARAIQQVANVDMPQVSRAGDYLSTIRTHSEHRRWEQVESPQEWDLVLMANVLQRDRHIGVYIRPNVAGTVIHAQEPMGV